MKAKRVKVGIVGCGAIGSRIAISIQKDLKKTCQLTAIFDIDCKKTQKLERILRQKNVAKASLTEVIKNCDLMIESVNAKNTLSIIRQAFNARKDVLAMSVGKLLNAQALFRLANQKKCHLLLPSGAIAGIDAIKAASLAGLKKIILTTRKPISGFKDNPYLIKKGIDLSKIKKATTLFEGDVQTAVKAFPLNINVAATIALACQAKKKLIIRIITSPKFKTNTHEIEVTGAFGHLKTYTDNVVCPDNPKTSYLAVLSGIQTLKQFCAGVFVGT